MSRPSLPDDGRVRRRVEAMRRVQDAALDLFAERGYAAVTVEDIAVSAGVGPATVYRNFGTKERVVLWDEYDPMLLDAVRERLGEQPLLPAVTDALVASIDRVYASDKRRILRRTRLMLAEPSLLAATNADRTALRGALAEIFVEARATSDPLDAAVAAAAVVATLEVAVERWAADRGRTAMRDVLGAAFGSLARLASASELPERRDR